MGQQYFLTTNNIITGLPQIDTANFPYTAPIQPTVSAFSEITVPDPDVNEIWSIAANTPPSEIWTEQTPKV
mgnify:FL=1